MQLFKIVFCSALLSFIVLPQQKRPIELTDIMKFKQLKETVISDNGTYIAAAIVPDRGNRELSVFNNTGKLLISIPRGENPVFSSDEKWLTILIGQDYFEKEKKSVEKYQSDLLLIRTSDLDTVRIKNADKAFFSKDDNWMLAFRKTIVKKDSSATAAKAPKDPPFELKTLFVENLERHDTVSISNTLDAAMDSTSSLVYYSLYDSTAKKGGLFRRDLLRSFFREEAIDTVGAPFIGSIQIDKNAEVAYIRAQFAAGKFTNGSLLLYSDKERKEITQAKLPGGWQIPFKNKLTFSKDANRLFFGISPRIPDKPKTVTDSTIDNNYSIDAIDAKRELDMWHWDDPLIKTQEKNLYKKQQEKLYTQVYDITADKVLALTDSLVTEAPFSNNAHYLLLYTNIPYRKEITWDDYYYDAYSYNLQTSSRSLIAKHLLETPSPSPAGSFGVYYQDKKWYLYDCVSGQSACLTDKIATPFCNEDFDQPAAPPSYGIGCWVDDDKVIINDKYDLWLFGKNDAAGKNLTKGEGRKNNISFRILKTNPKQENYAGTDSLLLSGYSDVDKSTNLYMLALSNGELTKLTNENLKYSFRQKAKNVPVYTFIKEDYDLLPDLWLTSASFSKPVKITKLGQQQDTFSWSKSELVSWLSNDGVKLDGVLIKPTNYTKGMKFPLIVYFYELFAQRLHEFPDMIINHRPNFAYYTSHGYGVLMPDVRFEIGEPGPSAVRCIVPGVLKLIEDGLVEPKGVGLIGHSWSGYEAAYMITQTDLFAAAVAGAPVGNMTSAYSGIRNESGMARQFQYEKSQSRIGGSLWEMRDKYIANSPIFFADRIHTPLLIEHGDEDEAVPFQQGVELYMAMRRLGNVCYFLQYRGEPHHPKKYPNKLDYAIKTKEFFDTYLKHSAMPEWMKTPAPYNE